MTGNIRHVGIIPDGNRRWARRVGVDYATAYRLAARNVIGFAEYLFEAGVSATSIYCLSKQNLERPSQELEVVFEAARELAVTHLPRLRAKHRFRLVVAGVPGRVPVEVERTLTEFVAETANENDHRLYILLGYDPVEEVAAAVRGAEGRPFALGQLSVPEAVDLVIRTGGGSTPLSNFLPLQCGYAQVHVLDDYFNDLTIESLRSVLAKARTEAFALGR
ncbi:MAG: undecaprenyl diphosphate synthase family protein [Myxococcota bacterium]